MSAFVVVGVGGLSGGDGFDAEFFGMSADEATAAAPAVRAALEACWEAAESAGVVLGDRRAETGVFLGAEPGAGLRVRTDTAAEALAGQVAGVLGLGGPAVTVDSASVALHLAVRSLATGGCALAFAGSDAGVVALERLSDASEPVLSVVRATTVTGAERFVSRREAHERGIRQALAAADLFDPVDESQVADGGLVETLLSPQSPLAAVTSVGADGIDVHVIVERAPSRPVADVEQGALTWVLSGRSPEVVRAQAERLGQRLRDDTQWSPADVAAALVSHRTLFEHRVAIVADDRPGFLRALDTVAAGASDMDVHSGRVRAGGVAFAFTGQGAQRPGMGRELHERFPVFAQAFDEVCAELSVHTGWSVADAVLSGADLGPTGVAQPALFAIEMALFRLVESWGVRPSHVIGHSIGEFAAACAAGLLSLPDACALVAARGRLMQALPEGGAMVALRASVDDVAVGATVSIAAVNSPNSLVLSGDEDALRELVDRLPGRRARWLTVSHAFHSARMDPMLEEFRAVAAGVSVGVPRFPLVSTLTGRPVDGVDLSGDYWVRQVREAVRFGDAVDYVARQGVSVFLELGPDAALCPMIRENVPDAVAAPALRRDRPEADTVRGALARLLVHGAVANPSAAYRGRWISLPTYPFQRAALSAGPDERFTRLLAAAPAADRADLALDMVREHIAAVLGMDVAAIGPDSDGFELGITSMLALELRQRLRADTGLELPLSVIFDCPTVAALSKHVLTELESGEPVMQP
ncbi:acyltransferase domain-containing protein [Kutzneria sp. NPDC052558]|uniref:acyltransferase domain-containing protein n=1 Tax=Kutzneria sp. NPDC052558 TaxID=3364121 RepID=UPI0037C55402